MFIAILSKRYCFKKGKNLKLTPIPGCQSWNINIIYNVVWMDSLCYLTCHTPWCMNHQWKCRATYCLWTQRSCSDGPVLWQEISTCHANTSTSLMYWGDTLTCRLCRILILALLLLNLWFPLNYIFISRSEINLKTFPFCLPGSGLEITV